MARLSSHPQPANEELNFILLPLSQDMVGALPRNDMQMFLEEKDYIVREDLLSK